MLTVNNISFSRAKKMILENLSFHVGKGECAVLAGPNGCGKSTALSLIAEVIKPNSGSIEKSEKIGYVPQDTSLIEDATVLENLRFFASVAKHPLPKSNPFSVDSIRDKTVSKLSGGMKKQVSISCALIGNPQIILLDEPCSSLDISFRKEMNDIIKYWKNEGKAIVYVGHDPSEFYDFFDYLIFVGTESEYYTRESLSPYASDILNFTEFYKKTINNFLVRR